MPITKETLTFLAENRLHDSREWFNAHRAEYEQAVLLPLRELVTALAPAMLGIDPLLISEPKVDRSISRIYRDTRFSADKSLYRENMWLVFMREKKLCFGLPAFYIDIAPSGMEYGMGYYMASSATMESMRTLILNGDPAFKKALAAFEAQSVFSINGDVYKRSKHADRPANIRQWLDRKSINFYAASKDFEFMFSESLSERLASDLRLLQPIYEFLCKVEAMKIKLV